MSKEKHEAKQLAAVEINRLTKANGGRITPSQLVEAARSPSSPLHQYFEWDNDAAAEMYRQDQARTLLRSCHVRYEVHNRKVVIPSYIRDPEADDAEQGYVPTATVKTDADLARDTLIREFVRAAALLTRARNLGAYFEMEDEISGFIDTLGIMRKRIEDHQPQLNA